MDKKLYYKILLYPIAMLILVAFTLVSYSIYQHQNNFQQLSNDLKMKFHTHYKEDTKNKVYTVFTRLNMHQKNTENILKKRIKDKTDKMIKMLNYLYYKYNNSLDESSMKKLLIDTIESFTFENKDNFFFVNDFNTNKIISHKRMPKLVGKDMTNHTDIKGLNLTLSKKKILKKQKSGFQKVYFKKPIKLNNKEYPKIVYFTKFKPYNWMIGTGEYIEDVKNNIQKEILNNISKIHNISNEDLFIWKVNKNIQEKNFTVLYSKDLKNIINKKPSKYIVNNIFTNKVIDNLEKNHYSYSKYKITKLNENISKEKFSYLYYFKEWEWIIGSGVFNEDIDFLLLEKRKNLKNTQIIKIQNTIIFIIFALLILGFIFYILLKQVVLLISRNEEIIRNLNKNLTNKLHIQIKELREKDMLLIQKSKNEELGELMAMITHQWRQPLNTINSTMAKLYQDVLLETITNDKLMVHIEEIENLTSFISKTIDDFNNFYTKEQNKSIFILKESINKVLKVIHSKHSLYKNIDISIKQKSKKKIYGLESIFQQVVLIIINNAIDNFKAKNIYKPKIDINIYQNNDSIYVMFQDNGGGIDNKILDTIFDLYVSTKKETSEGMGLYIARLILKTHFNAKITASNTNDGALFKLEFKNEKI